MIDYSTSIARVESAELDEVLGAKFPVLDHGFIRVVSYDGNDLSVVQAARVSYGLGTKTPSTDRGLIRYLLRHQHTTPFESCTLRLHVKLPIFVARQWMRHRTGSFNEVSGRYSVMPDEVHMPAAFAAQSAINRQGRADELPDTESLQADMRSAYAAQRVAYARLLQAGVARETAREVLPLAQYTEFYWRVDLLNLLKFLKLRLDSHAQAEITEYARVIEGILRRWVPVVAEAATDYVFDAETFSAMEMNVLRFALATYFEFDRTQSGTLAEAVREKAASFITNERERSEFFAKLDL